LLCFDREHFAVDVVLMIIESYYFFSASYLFVCSPFLQGIFKSKRKAQFLQGILKVKAKPRATRKYYQTPTSSTNT
jgi:hypothetical protein